MPVLIFFSSFFFVCVLYRQLDRQKTVIGRGDMDNTIKRIFSQTQSEARKTYLHSRFHMSSSHFYFSFFFPFTRFFSLKQRGRGRRKGLKMWQWRQMKRSHDQCVLALTVLFFIFSNHPAHTIILNVLAFWPEC